MLYYQWHHNPQNDGRYQPVFDICREICTYKIDYEKLQTLFRQHPSAAARAEFSKVATDEMKMSLLPYYDAKWKAMDKVDQVVKQLTEVLQVVGERTELLHRIGAHDDSSGYPGNVLRFWSIGPLAS